MDIYITMPLLLITILLLLLVGTDFILKTFYCLKRYHIGRWRSSDEWKSAVLSRALQWLRKMPVVPQTSLPTYALLDFIHNTKKNDTIQSWQHAGLALGIYAMNSYALSPELNRWLEQWIHSDGTWRQSVPKVDFAMMGYALSVIDTNYQHIRPAMDWVLSILQANLCEDGLVSYSQGTNTGVRYVDTLGMICPFLSRYGTLYHQPQYVDLAVHQITQFHDKAMWNMTALPCHAFDMHQNIPLGVYGWGRGTGWYLIALTDTRYELCDVPQKDLLTSFMKEAADYYYRFQAPDGGFCTILQGGGCYDSSITAIMAYFYLQCSIIFCNEAYHTVSMRCLQKLKQSTMKNGALDQCQGDTHGIGVFSTHFDILPFAQGILLRTIALMQERSSINNSEDHT